MKKYKVIERIALDFLTWDDAYGSWILPGSFLECDEHTIWVVFSDGIRLESSTVISVIDVLLRNKKIEEVK